MAVELTEAQPARNRLKKPAAPYKKNCLKIFEYLSTMPVIIIVHKPMKIKLTLLALAGMLVIAIPAQAGPRFGISINTGGYCQPRPVYCEPVYYHRPVVVYRPQIVYRSSRPIWNDGCGTRVVSRPIYRRVQSCDSYGWRR
jgi:hypothetical protein